MSPDTLQNVSDTNNSTPSNGASNEGEAFAMPARAHNMFKLMGQSPELLRSYRLLRDQFEKTSLTPVERHIVLMTASYENDCEYCVAAHCSIAKDDDVPNDIIEAIRSGNPLSDSKLEALRKFTSAVVLLRGWPHHEIRKNFIAAGYTIQQGLDVILGTGLKLLSNYTNHLTNPELDESFSDMVWKKG